MLPLRADCKIFMQGKILIVEDEASIREMVAFALKRAGMLCSEAADVRQAQVEVMKSLPDLILLDWMLPGVSGIEYAKQLRRDELTREIPVIMLTARGEEDDRIRGLQSGADDYLVKPFSTRELVARINAVLRRAAPYIESQSLSFGPLTIDRSGHRVLVDSKQLKLGPTEFRLLCFLATHPNRVYSRGQLLDHVWGANVYIHERTVDVHIRRVRKTLEPYQLEKLIQTVRGSGYRFSETQ
jgi:two-component system phosphate regulon response regulator PhoB